MKTSHRHTTSSLFLFLPHLLLFTLLTPNTAHAQFNLQGLANLAQQALNSGLLPSSQQSGPQCTPFTPPSNFKDLQSYCQYLTTVPDSQFDSMYRNATFSFTQSFPLDGCVAGCIVGRDSYQRGLRWGSGAWSGKCFDNTSTPKRVTNLLTPLPLGGVVNVLESFNWTSFLPTYANFPGEVGTGSSWYDALGLINNGLRIGSAYTILYDDVTAPDLPSQLAPLSEVTSLYADLVKGTRDEMRLVSPGFILGQMFRRPNTPPINPTPLPIPQRITFALFQVCDRTGMGFARGGNARDMRGGGGGGTGVNVGGGVSAMSGEKVTTVPR